MVMFHLLLVIWELYRKTCANNVLNLVTEENTPEFIVMNLHCLKIKHVGTSISVQVYSLICAIFFGFFPKSFYSGYLYSK